MRLIGLLGDSHGQAATTHRAVQILLDHGARTLIHLGDVGTVEVLDALATTAAGETEQIEAHVVFGNCDWNHQSLTQYAQNVGIAVDHPAGRLTVPVGDMVFCHGHEVGVLDRAIAEQVKYLCHGHTHHQADSHQGATRIINPGALFRANRYSVALLDCEVDRLQFVEIRKS